MFSFLLNLSPTLGGWAAKIGLGSLSSLAFLGPVGPVLTAIGTFIGSIISAIAEIIGAMARSYEGRIALVAIVTGLGLLWGRWHYIQQGRAEAPVKVVTRLVKAPPEIKVVTKYVKQACPSSKTATRGVF